MDTVFTALGVDEQLQPAVIQGFLSLIGVVFTGLVAIGTLFLNASIERRRRREDARLDRERQEKQAAAERKRRDDQITIERELRAANREERERDLRRAVWAEIVGIWRAAYDYWLRGDLDQQISRADAAFKEAEDNGEVFTPMVTTTTGSLFRDKLVEELVLLSESEINAVVKFYRHTAVVEELATSMRTREYAALSQNRKLRMLKNLLRMEDLMRDLGEAAILALEPELSPIAENKLDAMKTAAKQERPRNTGRDRTYPVPAPPASGQGREE